jgi:transcription termination factor Rho
MKPKGEALRMFALQREEEQTLDDLFRSVEEEKGIPHPEYSNREDFDKDRHLFVPATYLIKKVSWLRRFTKGQLMKQAEEQGLLLDPVYVEKWGIRNGDLIQFSQDETKLEPVLVNGIDSESISKGRIKIVGADSVEPQYAHERLPLERYGDVAVRAFTWLAPVGKGHRLFIVAPPNAGKTWVIRDVWKSSLKLTVDDQKLFVIGLHAGERAEDGTVLRTIRNETEHDRTRTEFYTSPDGDPEEAHFYMTEYVVERARRMCESGYDVVLVVDSFSRVLMSHSRSAKISKPSGAGLISGGVSTASVTAVKRLLSVAGDFGSGSLTIVGTMLVSGRNSNQRSSETSLFDETGPSTSTSQWVLVDFVTTPFPKIDVSNSHSREFERICTPEEFAEWKMIYKEIFDRAGPEVAVKRLISKAKKAVKERE